MPRNGHLTKLAHGTDLPAQVGYRLAGIDPGRSLSKRAQEAQVDYRLGEGRVDSRQVWFLGSGATAAQLDYRPGEWLTAADGAIVRDAMFGIDRRTGLRVRINEVSSGRSRLPGGQRLPRLGGVVLERWCHPKVAPGVTGGEGAAGLGLNPPGECSDEHECHEADHHDAQQNMHGLRVVPVLAVVECVRSGQGEWSPSTATRLPSRCRLPMAPGRSR